MAIKHGLEATAVQNVEDICCDYEVKTISASIWQSYSLWTRFCAILHF